MKKIEKIETGLDMKNIPCGCDVELTYSLIFKINEMIDALNELSDSIKEI